MIQDIELAREWADSCRFMIPQICYFSRAELRELQDLGLDIPIDDQGYFGRLSAPGYLDSTDWIGPYESYDAALIALWDLYELC